MKTLGLIGGTGPESTIDYYRLLTAQYREKAEGASPPVIINSVDLKRIIGWMNAGVDFAALTANTPHIVFDEIQQRTSLPLISIVEAARERTQALGFKSVAL